MSSSPPREPLRRRARVAALRALSKASDTALRPLVGASLQAVAGLARFSRYERVARANLELALGAELDSTQRARIARGVRAHGARLLGEWLRLASARRSPEAARRVDAWIERTVELDRSVAVVDELFARGNGLLIVTAHLGNWELLAAALNRRGLPGAVIGRHRRRDSSSNWLVEMRAQLGITTLPQDCAPREALEVLRRGHTLGILCDLEVPRLAGEVVPFFARPALTMSAPAALARAARLPIVPVRCVARGERYWLSVEPPLALDASLDRKAATLALLARMNATFERWIRETPEQWAWHQKRWPAAQEPPTDANGQRLQS